MADLLTYALCTAADVKESLGIDSGDTSKDNLIKRKINQATEMIEGYTFRRFKETTYTDEVYDATGTDQLLLRQSPVISFSSLSARDSSLNEDNFTSVDAEQYFVDNNSGLISGLSTFYGGYGRWRVTYTAGYSATNWPDALPWDLREACASLAGYLVNNDPSVAANVSRKKEGAREIQYSNSGSVENVLEELGIKATLDRYARYPISGYI